MGVAGLGKFGAKRAPVEPEAWTMPVAARALPSLGFTGQAFVRNQGGAGSCTGFGEYAVLAIIHGEGFVPSPGAMYWFNRLESGFNPRTQDSGAYMLPSVKALMRYGVGSEVLHPYVDSEWNVEPSPEYQAQALDHKVKAYYRALSVMQVKTAISQGLPAFASFDVPASFRETGESGVWSDRGGPAVGGHAVCIVGYDDAEHGGAFLVQNSWGTQWGTYHPEADDAEGFFWVPYEAYAGPRWWDSFVVTTWDLEAGR